MKKLLLSFALAMTSVMAFALSMSDVQWWVESTTYPGNDQAIFIVYRPCLGDAYCWGYKFDASQSPVVGDMMSDIQSVDANIEFDGIDAGFLNSITYNGTLNDDDKCGGSYWMYNLNDELAGLGLSSQPIANGDIILWEYKYDWSDWNCTTVANLPSITFVADPNAPTPTPPTDPFQAYFDAIQWWVPSSAHQGNTAKTFLVLNFSDGNFAWGYEWDGSSMSLLDMIRDIAAADSNLTITEGVGTAAGYVTSFTYGDHTFTEDWGCGLKEDDNFSFATFSNITIADHKRYVSSYNTYGVPALNALSNITYVAEPEPEPTDMSVTYVLTGCTGDEANPAEIDEETEELDLFFTLEDGYTWAGAEISVTMNGVAVSDIMADFEADPFFTWEPETGNLYIAGVEDYLAAPVVITITAKEASRFPEVFTPATFESVTTGANGVFYDPTLVLGNNEWLDGSFLFGTYYSNTWGDYYSDCVVSSLKDSTLVADYSNPVSYLAAAVNHAAEGNNYVAWNQNYYGIAPVKLGEAQVVSGMAVTNTSAFVNYILDAANNFHDTFTLTVSGYNNEELTGTIEFVLADFTTDTLKYAEQWQWLDLTSLGAVDKLMFNTLCADYMAPAYFCFDNLGGQAADCQLGAMTIIEPEPIYYTFAILNSENGTISSNVPCGALVENTEITVLASPATGYHFVSWSNGETANPYTFTLTEDTTISAIFEKDPETGLDELHTSAEKVMINGQVYILREGVRYTITGQVAE